MSNTQSYAESQFWVCYNQRSNLLFLPDMVFEGRGSGEEPDRPKAAQKMHSAIQLFIALNSFLT